MRKLSCLLVFALLMSSCASTTYRKPDATDEEFDSTITECEVKARQAGHTAEGWGAIARRKFITRCMHGQGWTAE